MTFQDIEKACEGLSTSDIMGKDYIEVNQRVKAFRKLLPSGTIETEIISLENGVITMRATVKNGDLVLATGTAQEIEGNGFINKTSFVENCETSAVGRALGFLGIGIDASIASFDEVANAKLNQGKTPKEVAKENEQKNQDADNKISKEEYDNLMMLIMQAGYGDKMIKAYQECFKVKDLKELSKVNYDALCSKIRGEMEAKNGKQRKAS